MSSEPICNFWTTLFDNFLKMLHIAIQIWYTYGSVQICGISIANANP